MYRNFCLKKLILTLFLVGFALVFALFSVAKAQELPEGDLTTSQEASIVLNQKTQNPETKEIVFELEIESNVTTDRARIVWQVSGASVFVEKETNITNLFLESGKKYLYPIRILPISSGQSEILVTLEIYKVDKRTGLSAHKIFFTNSNSEYLEIGENGELTLPADYTNLQSFTIIKNIFIIFGILVGIFIFAFVLIKLFAKWLNKEDRKAL